MKRLIAVLVFFLLSVPALGIAVPILTSDSAGTEKTYFYINDTIYVTSSTNITTTATSVMFYITNHTTWSSQMNLTTLSVTNKTLSTNSSGHVTPQSFWSPTRTGNFDLIADMNGNGTFDSNDYIYNGTGGGFPVAEQPVPRLTVSKGANSPADHNWYIDSSTSQKNVMLQIKLAAGSYDAVRVTSLSLLATGTGDDKNDISLVMVYSDDNGNGIYDQNEPIVAYGRYSVDEGVSNLDTADKLVINANSNVSVIFVYNMANASGSSSGKTYSFRLVSISAVGVNTGVAATVSGTPIDSAIKTVYSAGTTTTTTVAPTTTTTIPTTTTTAQAGETGELMLGLSITGFIVVVIVVLVYFFLLRPKKQVYSYTPT